MIVLVPGDLDLSLAPEGWEIRRYDPRRSPARSGRDDDAAEATALVTFDTPTAVLADYARATPRLRLVQALSAGVDGVQAAGFGPSVTICSGRGLHDLPVTEHALALLLAAARALPAAGRAQRAHRWATELGGRQPLRDPARFSTLLGSRIAIWGYGSIGRTLAHRLSALGAAPVGITRDGTEPGTVAAADLVRVLPTVDALVLLLPGTPENRRIVDARVLSLLPPRAWIVNVGRGSVVDEDALIDALDRRLISGAALDVFTTEPLPTDSPLWDRPDVIVTPHAAGGRPIGAEELIEDNLARLRRGEPLRNRLSGGEAKEDADAPRPHQPPG